MERVCMWENIESESESSESGDERKIKTVYARSVLVRFRKRTGLRRKVLQICDEHNPCCSLVMLYAKMGLQRYNYLNGKKYQLDRVERYTKSAGPPAASFYSIYLLANDPDDDSCTLHRDFKVQLREERIGKLLLSCYVATPIGVPEDKRTILCYSLFDNDFPKLPPGEIFVENRVGFSMMNNWERPNQDNIRLYLELAVATSDRTSRDHDLSHLKIVQVACQPMVNAPDGAECKIFYIRYKDSCEARVGKDVDRIAIVRRIFNRSTRCFSLSGQNQRFGIIPNEEAQVIPSKEAQVIPNEESPQVVSSVDGEDQSRPHFYVGQPLLRRLGALKMWRFSNPRRSRAFKNRGARSSHLKKTRRSI